jgi:protein ImuA
MRQPIRLSASSLPAGIAAGFAADHARREAGPRLALGDDAADARLGGGLAEGALHELYAAGEGDEAAAAAFALLLAARSTRPGPLVWLREDKARRDGRIYGLGLADLGFDPGRLILVEAPDTLALLRAAGEAVACPALAGVILEPVGKAAALDLTATRRLQLAAARAGMPVLLLRPGKPAPSAAHSRWQVAAAPSVQLEARAPGLPAFDLSLLRHRGGVAAFDTRLEWDPDGRAFRAPLPGGGLAAAPGRAAAAPIRHAA